MRKRIASLAIVLALAGASVLVAAPSVAHGTCTPSAQKPVRSGSSVYFTGSYNCGTTFHAITVTVYGQRRAGGSTGTFENIGSSTASNSNTTQRTTQFAAAFNCAKDYKTKTVGSATYQGVTHSGTATSTILQNTC
jgi:hypothetical protein